MVNLANVGARLQARYLRARRQRQARGQDGWRERSVTLRPTHQPVLWLMTDVVRLGTVDLILRALPVDATPWSIGVIIRHTDPRQRRALAEALVPLCRRRKVACVIAGDWALAARLQASGLHLSEHGARFGAGAAARLWRRSKSRLLTVAAHGGGGIAKAVRLQPDAILLAPVFATSSHPDALALGPVRFAALVRRAGVPVIALGGVTARTAPRLTGSGAAGLAGIGWARRDS